MMFAVVIVIGKCMSAAKSGGYDVVFFRSDDKQ